MRRSPSRIATPPLGGRLDLNGSVACCLSGGHVDAVALAGDHDTKPRGRRLRGTAVARPRGCSPAARRLVSWRGSSCACGDHDSPVLSFVELSDAEPAQSGVVGAARTSAQALALRSRIVLLAAMAGVERWRAKSGARCWKRCASGEIRELCIAWLQALVRLGSARSVSSRRSIETRCTVRFIRS